MRTIHSMKISAGAGTLGLALALIAGCGDDMAVDDVDTMPPSTTDTMPPSTTTPLPPAMPPETDIAPLENPAPPLDSQPEVVDDPAKATPSDDTTKDSPPEEG